MSEQIAIDFEHTHTRRGGPETSRQAARKMSTKAQSQCDLIVSILREHGPLTVYGIAEHSDMQAHAIGKRMSDLGGRARRTCASAPSPTGNPCAIWEACP